MRMSGRGEVREFAATMERRQARRDSLSQSPLTISGLNRQPLSMYASHSVAYRGNARSPPIPAPSEILIPTIRISPILITKHSFPTAIFLGSFFFLGAMCPPPLVVAPINDPSFPSRHSSSPKSPTMPQPVWTSDTRRYQLSSPVRERCVTQTPRKRGKAHWR